MKNSNSQCQCRWYNPLSWFKKPKNQDASEVEVPSELETEKKAESINSQDIQAIISNKLMQDLLLERRTERKWKWIQRIAISGASVVIFAIYVGFYISSNTDYKFIPNSELVGIVKINGQIDSESMASADKIIPSLKRAFESPKVKAVLITIDSPGGVPGESERINNIIDHYKETTKKPVYAVVQNVGASAAYLIAIHADKIYACNFCMVGSIGAVIHSWDFHKVMERYDVSQRIYASGVLKDMLNPYSEMNPESDKKAREMVNAMANTFAGEVKKYRGKKLNAEVNYFTGEVWTGADALKIGLIDELGTLEEIVQKNWDIKTFDFGPEPEKRSFLKNLTGSSNAATGLTEEAKAFVLSLLNSVSSNGLRF